MTAFIEEHRGVFGVGPICRVLPIAPSTFYAHAAVARDPDRSSSRAKQDKADSREIRRVFDASGGRYGARKFGTPFGVRVTTSLVAPWSG